jgi:hypothetical protein
VKLNARYVSIGDFDDLYFQVLFENEHPGADYDPSAPTEPYLILQRQFENDDGGVCYLETHDPDRFAGHFPLRLIEFTPPASPLTSTGQRIAPSKSPTLSARRFREVQRIVHIIFGGAAMRAGSRTSMIAKSPG